MVSHSKAEEIIFVPAATVAPTKWPGNLWEGWSAKLGRCLQLYSDLEYDHWVTVEIDPKIKSFCEQPVRKDLAGGLSGPLANMWIQFTDQREELRTLVSPSSESKVGESESSNLFELGKLKLRRVELTEQDVRSHPIRLRNQKQILHYLRARSLNAQTYDSCKDALLCKLHGGSRRLAELLESETHLREDSLYALFVLIVRGDVAGGLNAGPLSANTIFNLCP